VTRNGRTFGDALVEIVQTIFEGFVCLIICVVAMLLHPAGWIALMLIFIAIMSGCPPHPK
jgi:hypothetical protein